MSDWITPVARKDLLLSARDGAPVLRHAELLVILGGASFVGAAAIAMAAEGVELCWLHLAPYAVVTVGLVCALHAALLTEKLVSSERTGGTYEPLIMAGCSGLSFVRNKLEAALVMSALAQVYLLPFSLAGALFVGFPVWRLAGHLCLALVGSALWAAIAVWLATWPLGEAGGSPDRVLVSAVMALAAAAFLVTVLLVSVEISRGRLAMEWALGGAGPAALARLLALFFPPAALRFDSVRLFGCDVPFVALACLVNGALAAIVVALASAGHRHARFDASRHLRLLLLGVALIVMALVVGAVLEAPASRFALVVVMLVHLAGTYVLTPVAMAPTWPAAGAKEPPGAGGLANLLRERCGTGLAFLLVIHGCALLPYRIAASRLASAGGPPDLAFWCWLYVVVVCFAWAGIGFDLPVHERKHAGQGPGRLMDLSIAVLMASVVVLLERLSIPSIPVVGPVVVILFGWASLANPLLALGAVVLASTGPFYGGRLVELAARAARMEPWAFFWASLAAHGVVAIAGLVRIVRLRRGTSGEK